MNRLLLVGGILGTFLGMASIVPAIVEWLESGTFERAGYLVVVTASILIISGLSTICSGLRKLRSVAGSIPGSVRAAIAGNVCFLAFCALEASDGLIRQGGRVFYWTSVLFLPALLVLYGQVLAQRWAWWVARTVTALFTLWFIGFIVVIPFADLRGSDGAVPFWGRVYMAGITLMFASVSAYAFHSLGRSDARTYFGLAQKPEPKLTTLPRRS